MKKISEEIVPIGGYTFYICGKRARVALKRKGDAKEIVHIRRLYRKIRVKMKFPVSRGLAAARCLRCSNPECNFVVCLPMSQAKFFRKRGHRIHCSQKCGGKMVPHPRLSKKAKRKRRFIREFTNSELSLAVCEVLDLVQNPHPWNKGKLKLLIKKVPERIKDVVQEANKYSAARGIIEDSPIGDRILSLIEKP